jgi:uncharacterized membrane protein YjfL (UPF0719 family)
VQLEEWWSEPGTAKLLAGNFAGILWTGYQPMSDDEFVVLFVSTILAGACWLGWFYGCFRISHYLRLPRIRAVLVSAPLVAGLLLFAVLQLYADREVRDSALYLSFYLAFGAAWVGCLRLFLPLSEINPLHDGLHRGNSGAAIASAGMLFGLMFCFAGANIGDGPGWWVVLFSALLPTVAIFILWHILNLATRIAETVTVDRSLAAGWRAAGFWTGSGIALGRAAAGDWVSVEATLADFFATSWPVLTLLGVATLLELVLRPSPMHHKSPPFLFGVVPCVLYTGLGGLVALAMGCW